MIYPRSLKNLFHVLVGFFLISIFYFLFSPIAFAQSNIDATNRWAWNDVVGWIDFRYSESPNVNVTSSDIGGYASSSIGFISLNCASGPPESNCSIDYKVSNDASGNLAGWAWSDQIGWLSFCGNASGGSTWSGSAWVCPASPTYQVTISNGDFLGWAWNDIIGWISFSGQNDTDPDTAGVQPSPVSYQVQTSWGSGPKTGDLTSSIFYTNDSDGVAIDTIMWQGARNNGSVGFQIASSNIDNPDPWNFMGPLGTSAQSDVYGGGTAGPSTQTQIKLAHHNNVRYFRYKIFLESNAGGSQTPQVDDIIIGYSP